MAGGGDGEEVLVPGRRVLEEGPAVRDGDDPVLVAVNDEQRTGDLFDLFQIAETVFLVLVGYKTGTQVLGYVVFAEGFGQTGGVGSFRQGYAAAASVVLFILVMIFGLSANWFVNRRERKYLG